MIRYVITMLTAVMQDRKGISALEYAVLAAAIIGIVAAGASTVGANLTTVFATVGSDL